jgi:SAM-dependent methyltransferase
MPEPPFTCPLCGGGRYRRRIVLHDAVQRTTDESFTLVECLDCGLLRLYPPPSAETLAAAYPADYAPFQRPGLSGWAKDWLERRSVRGLWDYLEPPRRVLDVGCAGGELLAAIRDAGNPDVVGVEPDETAASAARARGIPVVTGFLEDARFADAEFMTVIASHTIEHVARPDAFLTEVNRILKPGGAVILRLPNVDSTEARLLGRHWIGYDAPRHLTTFSVTTIRRLLGETGFRVVRIDHEAVGLEWAWGLRLWLRERRPAAEPIMRRLHAGLIVLFTPLSLLSAKRRRSGRIRVIAIKRGASALTPVPSPNPGRGGPSKHSDSR